MSKTKVDLITGFLGAGKTTFIKKYLENCRSEETTIVIENEFGKAGVDMGILQAEEVEVTQLAGGCICCGLKVNFHDLLIQLAEDYDRIIVEPSGIYTLEDFYQIMESPAVEEVCTVGSILMIADSLQLKKLDEESEKVVYSQAAGAGQIVVSKIGVQDVVEAETTELLQNILESHGNYDRDVREYITFKDWDALEAGDFQSFRKCGYVRNRKNLSKQDHSMLFQNTTIAPSFDTYEAMKVFLKHVLSGECGEIIRAKGYLQLKDKSKYEINCTPRDWCVRRVDSICEEGINLIGRHMNRKAMKQYKRK